MRNIIKLTMLGLFTLFLLTGCGSATKYSTTYKVDPRLKNFELSDLDFTYNEQKKLIVFSVSKKAQDKYSQKEIYHTVMNHSAKFLKSKGFNYMRVSHKYQVVPFYLSGVKNISNLCFDSKKDNVKDFKPCSNLLTKYDKVFTFYGMEKPDMNLVSFDLNKTIADSQQYTISSIKPKDISSSYYGETLIKRY